jgi:hypothetical protein
MPAAKMLRIGAAAAGLIFSQQLKNTSQSFVA